MHVQNKLLRQNQASPGGGAAPSASSPPSASFPPSARSTPALDDDARGRISTSKEDASTALGQGRPSRGTPTPPGYGYLTRRLPRKITLTWVSNPATDEQVRIRETGGKETQLYITTTKCSGLGGRERHMHVQNKLLRQNQASPGGGAAPSASSPPSASFPPSARSTPALDDDARGRISTSKEDASTALGPTTAASSL